MEEISQEYLQVTLFAQKFTLSTWDLSLQMSTGVEMKVYVLAGQMPRLYSSFCTINLVPVGKHPDLHPPHFTTFMFLPHMSSPSLSYVHRSFQLRYQSELCCQHRKNSLEADGDIMAVLW